MSASTAIRRGRRAAEALMVDSCTITRGGGGQVFDPATGQYVTTPGETLYSGPCRVKPQNTADRVVESGGQAVSLWPFVVSVPMALEPYEDEFGDAYKTVAFQVDDLVTVTASQLDTAMVGLVLRVRQVALGSHLTARRLGCELNAG
jgi:hypothetical protein